MFPSFRELFNAYVSKFKEEKPSVDPTVKGSWSRAFGQGIASIGYAIVVFGKEIQKQFNPLTATGVFLELWASYDNLTRLGASPGLGTIKVFGDNGTIITAGEQWVGQTNGLLYQNASAQTIGPQDLDVASTVIISLTQTGGLVTASTMYPHGYTTDMEVRVSGADQSEYNGVFNVAIVPNDFEFQYYISGSPASPATTSTQFTAIRTVFAGFVSATGTEVEVFSDGDWTGVFVVGQDAFFEFPNAPEDEYAGVHELTHVEYNIAGYTIFRFDAVGTAFGGQPGGGEIQSVHANVIVQSLDNGPDVNLISGSILEYQGSIVGVDVEADAYEGIQGGANLETDDALRARLLQSRQAQEGIFTNDQITLAAKLINGNTNVYIQNPDSDLLADPDPILPGQVRVYILRADDPISVIPNGTVLELTKQSIILNGRLPAEMWPDDLEVLPPELLSVDIELSNIVPDTATMRTAIKQQFEAYFEDVDSFGKDLDNDKLRAVASQTKDLTAGNPNQVYLKTFDWTDAVETVGKNQLPILGTVTINGSVVP